MLIALTEPASCELPKLHIYICDFFTWLVNVLFVLNIFFCSSLCLIPTMNTHARLIHGHRESHVSVPVTSVGS